MIDLAVVEMDTRDIRGLELAAKAIGGITKKQLTPAVRKAVKPILQAARDNAPVDTGALKKGIVLKGERNRGLKKVFQVTFDRKKNDIFVKGLNEDGSGKRAYYPASQEYGFRKRNGAGKVPGKHFLRKAAEQQEDKVPDAIVDNLMSEIQKEWVKQHNG